MIMFEAEPIRDSQGNQWSKTELKCWRIHCSRSTTSFQRTSQLRRGENGTWFTQREAFSVTRRGTTMSVVVDLSCAINPAELCEWAQWERRTVIIERAWHKRNEECSQRRTISNESYQLKDREQCLHSHSKARHWADVSNRSRLRRKQKLVD